ncbi:hypothetical protein K8R14_01980, partial [bacterium]|nr:hypothetical protein [bacterium]
MKKTEGREELSFSIIKGLFMKIKILRILILFIFVFFVIQLQAPNCFGEKISVIASIFPVADMVKQVGG